MVSHWSIHCATQQAIIKSPEVSCTYDLNSIPPAWLFRKFTTLLFNKYLRRWCVVVIKGSVTHLFLFLSARLGKGTNNECSASDSRRFHNRWDFKLHVTVFFLCDYNLINCFCVLNTVVIRVLTWKKINQLRSRNSFLHVSQFLYSNLIRVGSTCLAVASCQKEQKRCPSSSNPLATFISFPFAEVDVQHQPAKTLIKSEITWKVSLLNSSIFRHNYHYITVTVTATYRKLWVVLKTCNRTP